MNLRNISIAAVAAILLFGGGYLTGRVAVPAKVVVTEKAVTVEKQVVVTQVKTEVQTVYVKEKKEAVHRVVTDVKKPDGSSVKTTTEDTATDTSVHKDTTEVKYVDRWNERVIEKTVEKQKLVLNKVTPDWTFGVESHTGLLQVRPALDVSVKPGWVGYVDRKLFGPIYAGAWAASDFKATDVAAGVSLGIAGGF